MNRGLTLFLIGLITLGSSWYGFVIAPLQQVGSEEPRSPRPPPPGMDATEQYPEAPLGMVNQGESVYRANGCVYCHTQQVRPSDVPRAGPRRTVARDYLFASPVQLGWARKGPDLSNVGERQSGIDWHLRHLYAPQSVVPDSTMPPYRYLFRKQEIVGDPSPDALTLTNEWAPELGYEIVPTDKAKALARYLVARQANTPLFEAPVVSETNNVSTADQEGASP